LSIDDLAYGDPGGYLPLRMAIASYLRTARAAQCTPDQVIVTNGAQHALGLAAHVLLDGGEPVWVENPGYRGAKAAFVKAGLRVVPVPLDGDGISITRGRELAPNARLVYVTPSHQYPTGITTSATRRLELIEWARQSNAWILEDDYDSEYRYDGAPLPSLHHLDPDGRVVYCGSFSKVLAPGLRIGYLVVPELLIDAFRRVRSADDHQSSIIIQIVLARFIERGHYGRHLRRQRKLGLQRRNVLIEAFRKRLPHLTLEGTGGGLHALVRFPLRTDDAELGLRAADAGISLSPLSAFDAHDEPERGLVLGYAAFPDDIIRQAVKALASILPDDLPARGQAQRADLHEPPSG
jgi:GntR family transcriptional regulator/MocR family aminotransferase